MASERANRRLAAILAADVVGFSRLVSADEEGTIHRLSELRNNEIDPAIDQHNGRIFKTTGDGILAEFPSVVDAMRSAIQIQEKLAAINTALPQADRMVFRIGVNLGDIIVQDEDILGDGVNIAARLEGLAKPGGICISGKVHDEVQGKIEIGFAYTGEHTVKNIDTPIPVYELIPDPAAPGVVADTRPGRKHGKQLALAVALLAVVLVAGFLLWQQYSQQSQTSAAAVAHEDGQSIAVLPFQNFSNDPEQTYFADGIAEDIITDLSKISSLFVTARNSSFQYRGRQCRRCQSRQGTRCEVHSRRLRAQSRRQCANQCAAYRRGQRRARVGRAL